MIGGVVINVYIIVVQGKTVRPRANIIGVEDNVQSSIVLRGQEVQAWCHWGASTLVGNQVEVE